MRWRFGVIFGRSFYVFIATLVLVLTVVKVYESMNAR